MKQYSELADSVVQDEDLLKKLRPTETSNVSKLLKIRAASEAELGDGQPVTNPAMFALVRAGLIYACDALEESHVIVQATDGDESAYWHGMIHRREGDFENARYWFRRAGILPFFGELHHVASAVSSVVAAQSDWDPYLFTGLCERNKYGETETTGELQKLQRMEFEVVFDYVWRRSFATPSK